MTQKRMMFSIKLILVTTFVFLSIKPSFAQLQGEPFVFFDVKPNAGQKVFIQWKIIPAIDSLRFEVERSRDKTIWIKIADITVRTSHLYSSIDAVPEEGLSYYRVVQVANKGQSSYSDIKWVQINKADKLYLWPNPVSSVLHVKTPFVKGSIDIYDSDGRFISKKSIINLITDISTGRLSKGIYFLHIRHDKETLVEKFVKD